MKLLRFSLFPLLLLISASVGFIIAALTLGRYSPNMLLELVSGDTPQDRIRTYLRAIQAQDRPAALTAWTLPAASSDDYPPLNERRDRITDELLARQITGFTIFEPQWWGTCCDPGVTSLARNAGGARVRVQVIDTQGNPWGYFFDVFVPAPYFGDAEGNQYRHWLLRDVYPPADLPLYWPLWYTGAVHSP